MHWERSLRWAMASELNRLICFALAIWGAFADIKDMADKPTIQETKAPNSPIVTIGSWMIGIGLILLAVQCLVYPGAAEGYGVSPLDERGFAYLLATGMRDLTLGIITIYLLLNFRAALGFFFLAMLVVPIADTLIVMRYGNSLFSIWLHAGGLAFLATLSILCIRERC